MEGVELTQHVGVGSRVVLAHDVLEGEVVGRGVHGGGKGAVVTLTAADLMLSSASQTPSVPPGAALVARRMKAAQAGSRSRAAHAAGGAAAAMDAAAVVKACLLHVLCSIDDWGKLCCSKHTTAHVLPLSSQRPMYSTTITALPAAGQRRRVLIKRTY